MLQNQNNMLEQLLAPLAVKDRRVRTNLGYQSLFGYAHPPQ